MSGTEISAGQKTVHVVTEAIAVALIVPWLLKIASDPKIKSSDRVVAGMIAVGTIIVDGGLLAKFASERKRVNQ